MRIPRLLLITILLGLHITPVVGGTVVQTPVTVVESCGLKPQVVVIPGLQLPVLHGAAVDRVAVFRWSGTELDPIPFQIDQRDEKNRYIIPTAADVKADSEGGRFDANDELALLFQDAGERMPDVAGHTRQDGLVEVELHDQRTDIRRWLYLGKQTTAAAAMRPAYVHYSVAQDAVNAAGFQIGFSKTTPFLAETLRWRTSSGEDWSPDVLDIMKIRHVGKLFGFVPFVRHSGDYTSKLVAVKQGPVRIIRRTKNQVRMFWKLKTPTLLVDYVIAPDGFNMDTIIDIPFPVGLFFSEAVTLTTIDWNSAAALPSLHVYSGTQKNALLVDGRMSAAKTAFNALAQTELGIDSSLGTIKVTLHIPDDFPIVPSLYLRDDKTSADEPEQDPGQYGNVGFITRGWEKIDTKVHHMEFKACLSARQGMTAGAAPGGTQHVQLR